MKKKIISLILISSIASAVTAMPAVSANNTDGNPVVLMCAMSGDAHTTNVKAEDLANNPVIMMSLAYADTNPDQAVSVETFGDYSQDLGYGALASHWGLADISYLVSQGAIKGVPNSQGGTSFEANRTITRAEFATILARLLDTNGKADEAYNTILNDNGFEYKTVAEYEAEFDWFAGTMMLLDYIGNSIGSENGATWLNTEITRDEMANLAIQMSEKLKNEKYSQMDTEDLEYLINDWSEVYKNKYKKDIYKAYSNGILVGDNMGNYNPSSKATRAEACAIISRVIDPARRKDVNSLLADAKANASGTQSSTSSGKSDVEDIPTYEAQTTVLYQSDVDRRDVQEGDIFVDLNGKEWLVKRDPISGTFNPGDPVGFDLNRRTSLGGLTYAEYVDEDGERIICDCDGTCGGLLGDYMLTGPNGHIAWRSEWNAIANSEWDKPTQPGTYDGELSPNKLYKWVAKVQIWSWNGPRL